MIDLLARYNEGQRDFRSVDLRGARLQKQNLSDADLSGANLRGADLSGACLQGAKLHDICCGQRFHWRLLRDLLGATVGVVSGLIIVGVAIFIAAPFSPDLWKYLHYHTESLSDITTIFAVPSLYLAWRVIRPIALVIVASTAAVASAIASAAGITAAVGPMTVVISGSIIGLHRLTVQPTRVAVIFLLAIIVQIVAVLVLRWQVRRGTYELTWTHNLAVTLQGIGGTHFRGADLRKADLRGADLRGADLRGVRFVDTSFYGALNLEWARFDPGDLRKRTVQRLVTTRLNTKLDFSGVRLYGICLSGGNLSRTRFIGADLNDVNLSDADLRGANLRQADLRGANLSGAKLDGADWQNARIDSTTYVRSGWSPQELKGLVSCGVEIVAREAFPLAAQDVMDGRSTRPGLQVVILCSPFEEDMSLSKELVTHLAQLRSQGLIETPHTLEAGDLIDERLEQQIKTANVVLVLLSPNFLDDDKCQQRMQLALKVNNVRIVPVVIRACDWKHSLVGKLQPLPEDGRPVKDKDGSASARDSAWVKVVNGLRHLVAASSVRPAITK